jgi:hypothetical protein
MRPATDEALTCLEIFEYLKADDGAIVFEHPATGPAPGTRAQIARFLAD